MTQKYIILTIIILLILGSAAFLGYQKFRMNSVGMTNTTSFERDLANAAKLRRSTSTPEQDAANAAQLRR